MFSLTSFTALVLLLFRSLSNNHYYCSASPLPVVKQSSQATTIQPRPRPQQYDIIQELENYSYDININNINSTSTSNSTNTSNKQQQQQQQQHHHQQQQQQQPSPPPPPHRHQLSRRSYNNQPSLPRQQATTINKMIVNALPKINEKVLGLLRSYDPYEANNRVVMEGTLLLIKYKVTLQKVLGLSNMKLLGTKLLKLDLSGQSASQLELNIQGSGLFINAFLSTALLSTAVTVGIDQVGVKAIVDCYINGDSLMVDFGKIKQLSLDLEGVDLKVTGLQIPLLNSIINNVIKANMPLVLKLLKGIIEENLAGFLNVELANFFPIDMKTIIQKIMY